MSERWRHDHTFGQQHARPGERRTFVVIAVTATTMVIEIAAGLAFGSMALLADGLHMASHSVALGLSAVAYVFARRRAHDPSFSFGTGKVNALAGFTGAILLAGFALFMAIESFERFARPVAIEFDYAIGVAVLGLLVNGVSVLILGGAHGTHGHGHGTHGHGDKTQSHGAHGTQSHGAHETQSHGAHETQSHGAHDHGHEDHNLRSAYLHVLADALTSLLAIFALLGAKVFGLAWLDPLMGVVGALLVANWSRGLIKQTGQVLLDRQGSPELREAVRCAIEAEADNRIVDLHLWSIGPGIYAAEIALVTDAPQAPEHYKSLLPADHGLVHVTVEVHRRADAPLGGD